MTPIALLRVCASKKITLMAVNGELRYRAPTGVISDDFKAQLKKYKNLLINILSGESNYRFVFSKALNREVIISWNGENPKVVFVDSAPYSAQEIQRLKESQLSAQQTKIIHEIKEHFDGSLLE